MPPSRWPGTVQKNAYSPGLRSTVTSDVPPSLTTSPASLTPLPSTAMLWSLVWGFSEVILTLPAEAVASANL